MIAEVIPRLRLFRTLGTFEYQIPGHLSVASGDLVLIPWRTKVLLGAVLRVTSRSRVPQKKLRPILRVIVTQAFCPAYLDALLWFSKYYFISPASALHTWLPEIPQKRVPYALTKFSHTVIRPEEPLGHSLSNSVFQKYTSQIITRIFHAKSTTLVCSRFEEKVYFYHELLLRRCQGTVVIITPTVFDVEKLCKALAPWHPLPFHSQISRKKLWEHFWLSHKDPHTRVVIGTKKAIFSLPEKFSLLIIDQEESPHHKQYDQNPRYTVHDLAFYFVRKALSHVVFVSHAPRATTAFHTELLSITPVRARDLLQIIDMNLFPRHAAFTLFSDMLAQFISSHSPAFIFHNRTGFARYLVCHVCNRVYTFSSVTRCQQCGSTHLTSAGFGTQKIFQDIQHLLPPKHIYIFDRFHRHDPPNNTNVIGTEFAFDKLDFERFQSFVVLGIDRQLALPSWRAHERVFQLLSFFATFGHPIFIPTFAPKHFVLQSLLSNTLQKFYEHELRLRQNFSYPPFVKLIKVIDPKSKAISLLKNPPRTWQPPTNALVDVDPDLFLQ